ncbi:MAG: hypothetical protein D3923_01725 [Candidatus Electrothrix sp. AR3]|nr:hypothetical protein [Candidatus Electrothrix sp. AR3]
MVSCKDEYFIKSTILPIIGTIKPKMITRSSEKFIIDDFKTIMGRIESATEIRNLNQLSRIINIPQSTISRKRSINQFEVDWAYRLSIKFDLSIDWILKGENPKNKNELIREDKYIEMLEEWLKDHSLSDARNRAVFEVSLEKTFPEFKEWLDKKNKME